MQNPIGIKPEYIWLEDRLKELEEAIKRYVIAGIDVPRSWIEEFVHNEKRISSYRYK